MLIRYTLIIFRKDSLSSNPNNLKIKAITRTACYGPPLVLLKIYCNKFSYSVHCAPPPPLSSSYCINIRSSLPKPAKAWNCAKKIEIKTQKTLSEMKFKIKSLFSVQDIWLKFLSKVLQLKDTSELEMP